MAKEKLAKHYVKVDTTVPQPQPRVSVRRKSNTSAAKFDFEICAMADNLGIDAKIKNAKILATALDASI